MKLRALVLACVFAISACRQIAGIQDLPQPCSNPLMIDDMEDGDGNICQVAGRHGPWWTSGDGSDGTLDPVPAATFIPTDIPGGRDQSRKAAHMKGSGFTNWGAQMGFHLNFVDLFPQGYNTGDVGGLKFWMKSNAPLVKVLVGTQATVPVSRGGPCMDTDETANCDNDFLVGITAPNPDEWVEYKVPYSALSQHGLGVDAADNFIAGSAVFNAAEITTVKFQVPGKDPFEVWIDDVSFDYCGSCLPTCADPRAPVACPAADGQPAGCAPPGTDCSKLSPALRSNLFNVAGSGPDDVWVVGWNPRVSATALRWDGTRWSDVSPNVDSALNGVWVGAPGDVWAVGDFGVAQHWDGAAWTAFPTGVGGPLMSAWGSGTRDVWVVGGGGTILHWDGDRWSPSAGGTSQFLERVWGTSSDDVWVVGDGGTILHWNGTDWSTPASGASADLYGVWGSSPDDVWVVGGDGVTGTIRHWDGMRWSTAGDNTTKFVTSVWGSGPDDVWAVDPGDFLDGTLLHWNGSAWTHAPGGSTVSVWGTGPDDVWAVGLAGTFSTIIHWDGVAWSPADPAHMP